MKECEGKTLLILGAGRGQLGLYKAAREMGVRTIAGTLPDNDPPCIPLADEVCYMNILNPEEVVEKTKNIHFDGVATCCLDKGLKALGRLCDTRKLPGFHESSAELCNDKLLMKQRFMENGVRTAGFIKIDSESQLSDAVISLGGFPVIVKATDLAGSRGIYIANNEEEVKYGFCNAFKATQKDYVIIEKFIKGNEFGAQAFIQNGKVYFVMPHGDILFHGATNVPIGHYVPFDASEKINTGIYNEAFKAIKAVALDNCAVNIDFIEENGDIYVLELSGRIGANGLPEVVSANYGIDYYKMVILASLGISVDSIWMQRKECCAAMSRMVISKNKKGILKHLAYCGPNYDNIIDFNLFAKPGTPIHKFENTTHCLGQFTVIGESVKECQELVDKISENILIDVV